MKESHLEIATNILKFVPESTYEVYVGTIDLYPLSAHCGSDYFSLTLNVASMAKPTNQKALALLEKILALYQELPDLKPELKTMLENLSFLAAVLVDSGHMSLQILESRAGVITWFSNLD